jgi:hypothetical protein
VVPPPVIHTSKPGQELDPIRELGSPTTPAAATLTRPSGDASVTVPPDSSGSSGSHAARPSNRAFEPRRFHISRASIDPAPGSRAVEAGVSRRNRYARAVFVERAQKSLRRSQPTLQPAATASGSASPDHIADTPMDDVEIAEAPRPRKPRTRSRLAPSSKTKSLPAWNGDMEQVTADMNSWVMHEIGVNLAELDDRRTKSSPAKPSTPSKFKPKAPPMRFAERHPEIGNSVHKPIDNPTDSDSSEGDEDDWVVEEYVRVPADNLDHAISPENIGVLVLDTEEDTEFFHGVEQDSEEEMEDDEDENGISFYY